MIKGISRINGLGVYEDYTRPAETHEFGLKNLIYGWNYSGKTTLSRIFALLESKKPNPDLTGCEFRFETNTDPITDKNFEESDLTVRVFNSDFVRANLHFDGSSFNPILLLGKESEEAQARIDRLVGRIKRSEEVRKRLGRQYDDLLQLVSNAKTERARFVRQLLKIDPYTAAHLGGDMVAVGRLGSQLLSERELSESCEVALTPINMKPSAVAKLAATLEIEALHKEAQTVLAATPSFSNTLKHLEANPDIERWVETGLNIHPREGACEFCGNEVSEERLGLFRAHFSKDLVDHKKRLESLLQRVKRAELKLLAPSETELSPQFRGDYRDAARSLSVVMAAFNDAVKVLADDVQRKVDSPLRPMEPVPLADGLIQCVNDVIDGINAVIAMNNELAENFESARNEAIRRVKYHYVQEFIDSQESAGCERKATRLIGRRDRLQRFVAALEYEGQKLQALISQAQLGRERVNARLISMLGSEAVQIDVVKDLDTNQERFRLIRKNGEVAKNLSDGERTAIAFSYFLTKLQELKPEQFAQTIVYIDDPISSLDANHLFQVNAAIKEFFFWKNEAGKWSTRCRQFFLSTHNFQFFDLIREVDPKKAPRARLYFLRKVGPRKSVLGNMPRSLSKYSSEYHFLFETILKFRACPDKPSYEGLLLLPIAVRRFVELYTYSRMPVDLDSENVDRRAEALFGAERAKRILKVLHYFSHANNMEKFAGNSEVIFDLEYAIEDLLAAIETEDPLHWNSLMGAMQA